MDSSFETVDDDRPSGATSPQTRSRSADSISMDLFENPTAEYRGSLLCAREDVIQDVPEHKAKHLLFTPHPYGTIRRSITRVSALPKPRRSENGYLLARFSITLDENGHLRSSKRLHEGLDADEDGRVWFAYVESDTPCDTSSNGEVAGRFPESEIEDVSMPWAKDLPETFSNAYGQDADLIGSIPELIWDLPGDAPSLARYRFHKHVNSTLDLSLRSTVNDVPLAGRMLEYTKAKQRASIARQNGTRAAASQVRAGPGSSFTLEAYKASGDWQSALGLSMPSRGPVSVDFHIPWWKECGFVEDHFARVNVAMARGRPLTRVAVIDPIESAWIRFGPGTNFPLRRDREFVRLASWLFRGLVDFDVVSESLPHGQIAGDDVSNPLRVGKCAYDVVILPKMRTIRSTTLSAIRTFAAAGGKVVIVGEAPSLIDAQTPPADDRSLDIVPCTRVAWSQEGLLEAISDQRELRIDHADGRRGQSFLHQMRESDNDERLVFICNTDRTSPYDTVVRIKGDWDVDVLDTFNGAVSLQKSRSEKGWTVFEHRFEGCASLLLRLRAVPAEDLSFVEVAADAVLASPKQETVDLKLEEVLLSEPNVLLLDRACYRIDDDAWDAAEPQDVLKIDDEIRSRLRLPPRDAARGHAQAETAPQPERTARAYVDLRFEFESTLLMEAPTHLAMANPGNARIAINGHKLPLPADGDKDAKAWWAEERIRTIPIPGRTIRKGANTIELSMPFGPAAILGRVYLLGSFSIDISAGAPVLRERRRGLGWGNVVTQGHPFYAGDVTYRCSFSLGAQSDVILSATQFAAPVVRVRWGSGRSGHIALRPRRLNLGELEAGRHEVCITAFGGRHNAFGDVHMAADAGGPEYKLTPTGILEKPTLIVEDKTEDGEDWVVLAE